MNRQKLLTIAIPTFNLGREAAVLVDDIVGVLNSEFIDVLIIDDGSTDDTVDACSLMVEKYPDIVRLISKENGHYGSAVNCAIQNASGVFFKTVDADDRVDRKGLSALLHQLGAATDEDMFVTNYCVEYHGGRVVEHVPVFEKSPDGSIDLGSLRSLPMHAITYRTDLLADNCIKLDTGVPYTDVEFVLFPLPFVKKAAYLDCTVYRYQIGREGQSVDARQLVASRRKHQLVLTALIRWYESSEVELKRAGVIDFARIRIMEMFDKQVQISLECDTPLDEVAGLRLLRTRIKSSSLIHGVSACRPPIRVLMDMNFRFFGVASSLYKFIRKAVG